MKQFLLSLIGCLSFFISVEGQQLSYPSYHNISHFMWNPAMTAPWDYMQGGIMYRQQWLSFNQAPTTAIAAVQIPFPNLNMSLGVGLMHDQLVALNQNSATLSYAYHLPLGYDSQVSFGLAGVFSQYRFELDEIIANDPNDQLLLDGADSRFKPNAMAGLFFVSNTDYWDESFFFVGLGASQLIPLDLLFEESTEEANLERVIHANAILGYRFVNDYIFFEPQLWVNYSSPNLFNGRLQINMEYFETFFGSLGYSSDNALSLTGGMIIAADWLNEGQLYVGGRANMSIGPIGQHKGIGYEVLVSYRLER